MILKATDVGVKYGTHRALEAFSLGFSPGEIVALIGPNGSGKSTALHALAGLTSPDEGEVVLDGREMRSWKRRSLAKRLSFLPQAPYAPDEMSVEQLVRQGRFAHVGLFQSFRGEDRAVVEWALESTGLGDLANRGLKELSGGERQRAWIAAALAQESGILVLDEPTSFLDIGHQVEILELISRLSRERGVTVIIAIHDLNHAMAIADRIALLSAGKLVFEGSPMALSLTGLLEATFNVRGEFIRSSSAEAPYLQIRVGR
ncbi:ABC transporter ATP-binding protein [Mesorhizobium plurifarium]|uniref:ABC transporter ATP-binding protein n=1 Tax=Sinorhizobium arboris TaxID=76745 RepID=UPI0003FDDB6E|nr:ABC transporter ATP-binding protein [Sinorhizobium arboris]PST24155.1 ABC transporter ATP-binding protein [Mesorhizobium plurifarium]